MTTKQRTKACALTQRTTDQNRIAQAAPVGSERESAAAQRQSESAVSLTPLCTAAVFIAQAATVGPELESAATPGRPKSAAATHRSVRRHRLHRKPVMAP
jgi:hypothetical protein